MFIKIRGKLYNLSNADSIATSTDEKGVNTIWFVRGRIAYDWIEFQKDEVAEFTETHHRIVDKVIDYN